MFIGIIALAEGGKRLIEINLSGCPLVSDNSVQALAENCDNLRSVNLAYTNITDEGGYYLAYGACGPKLQVGLFYCSHRLSSPLTFSFLLSLRFSFWRPLNTACGQDGGESTNRLSHLPRFRGVFDQLYQHSEMYKSGVFSKLTYWKWLRRGYLTLVEVILEDFC